MQGLVREAVSTKVDLLATDEHPSYRGLTDFPHEFVRHSRKKYMAGAVHTQTIDGFWNLIEPLHHSTRSANGSVADVAGRET